MTRASPQASENKRETINFYEDSTTPQSLALRKTTVAQGNRDPASPVKMPLHASRTGSNSSPHTSAPLHTNTRSWVSSTCFFFLRHRRHRHKNKKGKKKVR